MDERHAACLLKQGLSIAADTCETWQKYRLASPDEDAVERNLRHCRTCDHRIAEPSQGRLRYGGTNERMAE
jgi:hypothetical protein